MKRRGAYILAGIILLLAAAVCGVWIFKGTYAPRTVLSESMEPAAEANPVAVSEPKPTAAAKETAVPAETAEPYECPVDFEALQSINPDIYAWLEVDGTNISYPIVQGADNSFYLNHNSDRNYSANGAIFSEDYNALDFSDPVTVLYGHHMKSGAMFGNLQKDFSNGEFFRETDKIVVYTPEGKLEYGVFAAVPYPGEHLLYNYDFSNDSAYESFFEGVFNVRSLEAQFREEYAPQPGDRVLVLSTCLTSNNTRRFLVMATLLP